MYFVDPGNAIDRVLRKALELAEEDSNTKVWVTSVMMMCEGGNTRLRVYCKLSEELEVKV